MGGWAYALSLKLDRLLSENYIGPPRLKRTLAVVLLIMLLLAFRFAR
jgi:hypothetical protein